MTTPPNQQPSTGRAPLPWRAAVRVTSDAVRGTVRADVPGTERGVALLVVLVTLAVMGALSTEFAYNTRANIWMAGNVTASTQAYYHARSVGQIAELAVNAKKNFPQIKTAMSLMGKAGGAKLEIWRQACEFAKIFATGRASFFGMDIIDLSEEDAVGFKAGDFDCKVTAEDSRTNLNAAATDPPSNVGPFGGAGDGAGAAGGRPGAEKGGKARANPRMTPRREEQQRKQLGLKLFGLFRPMLDTGEFDSEDEMIDLIINIMDWTDADELRTDVDANGNFVPGVGDEGADYTQLEWSPKNAKFDTIGEIQLVAGMASDVFCQVRENFTVFSTGKLNVNDADLPTLKGVLCQGFDDPIMELQLCWNYMPGILPVMDQALMALETCRELKKAAYSTPFTSMSQFSNFIKRFPAILGNGTQLPINPRVINEHLGVLTTMVRVESTGIFRGTKRKITTIYDQATGEPVYHHVE